MREIKFRVWFEDSNMMLLPEKGNIIYSEYNPDYGQNHAMQYTGLKDKNGVEIYEGDIIQIPDDYDSYGMNAGDKLEVYFNEGGFRFKPKYNKKSVGYWLENTEEYEIIGNIYKNPEMIK